MQLTKGAIGNLINRYRAVLKKCHLMNVFGSLAVAGMLVMGGAGAAGATQWQDMPDNPTITIDQPNQQNNFDDVKEGQTVVVNGANTATGAETSMAITGQADKPGVNYGDIWVISGEGGTGNGYAEGMGGVYNSQFSIINEGNIFVDGSSASKVKAMGVNPNGSAENKGLIVIKNGGGIVDNSGSASKTMINSGTIAVEAEGGIGIFYRKKAITDGTVANNGTITASNGGTGVLITNDTDDSTYNGKTFTNTGTILADADSVAIQTWNTKDATVKLESNSHIEGLISLLGTNNKLDINGVGTNAQENLYVKGTLSGSIGNSSNIAFTEDSQMGIDGAYSIDNTSTATLNNVTLIAGDNDASMALVVIGNDSVTLNGGLNTGADNTINGITSDKGNVHMNDATFEDNTFTADRNYPIIGAVAANLGDEQSLTITGSTFEGNRVELTGTGSSGSSGGAAVSVVGQGKDSTLTIADSTFTNNHYQDTSSAANGAYGGAIGVQNTSVILNKVEMSGNSADSGNQVQGGAYYQSKGSLTADNITVSENTVTTTSNVLGGGMSLFGVGGSISNSTFAGNIASSDGTALGGGLYVKGDASNGTADGNGKISLELAGVTFDGNKVNGATESQGGALYILGADDPANATVTVNGSVFSNNKAEGANGWGGAIYNAGTLTVNGGEFTGNEAGKYGGAIAGDVEGQGSLDITSATFTGNTSGSGGAIALWSDGIKDAAKHTITARFEGNTAERKGGAIAFLANHSGNKTVNASISGEFLNNSAGESGGAIHSERATLTITDATFSGNSAELQGGAIYNDAASSITFTGTNTFSGNTAAEGKDIYNEGTLTFAGTNTQMDGGMVMANGTMEVTDSQVSMAELAAEGGSITAKGSELTVGQLKNNALDSDLTVGTDGIVNIGNLDSAKLAEAMNDAGMGAGSAILALNTSMDMGNATRLVVGTDESERADAVFGKDSLLVVDANGVTDKQVIHAQKDDPSTAFIHSQAQLRIINAVAGEYVTVLNGFETITDENKILGVGWTNEDGVENLDYMLSSYAMIVEGPDGQPDVVVYSELNAPTEALPGIDPDLAPVLFSVWSNGLNDVDSSDMGVRFLSRAVRADYINGDAAKSAATIESAARIAFAGAVPQMTKMASDAATNAVVNRLGFANPADGAQAMNAEGQIVDRNTTGFALWIAPLWQSQHGWGMEAGNLDYGFNGNLGGVSLGADYTFENAIRAGITFNIGGGYAETSGGDLNSTENRMTFWGLGAYAGWNYENFGLMADVSYTSTWNQLEQDLDPGMGMGDLEADVQATAISAGLRAEYKLETSVLDIIPHVGVRYMSLNTWGYDVDANGGTVMEGDGFHQDIWTFPVGVTFSKDITLDSGWFFKPSVDFSVIPAAGDIKAREDVRFTGAPAVAEMETQMMDYLTWQGGVGVQLGNDNLSFGVNYTLQAGQNTTGHGVFGNFRYEF